MFSRLSWLPQVFSLEVRRVLAYRSAFWIQYLGNIFMTLIISYFLWDAVYSSSGQNSIGGYSFHKMVLYYVTVRFIGRMFEGYDLANIQHDIYSGQLTRFIIYPVSVLLWKYIVSLAQLFVYGQQLVLSFAVYFAIFPAPQDIAISFGSIAMFLASMLIAATLHYLLIFAVGAIAFWVEQVWTMVVMFRFIGSVVGGALVPLALFPDWCRSAFDILPFHIIYSFPIKSLFGDISLTTWWKEVVQGFVWCLLAYLLARFVLERGKYRYTGVGI